MAVGLGLREGEILQSDWGWIDWRTRSFIVGGVSQAKDVTIKDRAIRVIPIPAWLLSHLNGLWLAAGKPSSGLVLPQEKGVKHEAQFLKKPVARCGLLVGVPGLTPHCLRATWATGSYETGTPVSQIQQMMGHEDPSTTLKYIVTRPKDQAEAQERLARAMGLSDPPIFTNKFKRLLQNNKIKILIKLPGAS
jgi:integrase